jgi:hypothetical protein
MQLQPNIDEDDPAQGAFTTGFVALPGEQIHATWRVPAER